ADAERERDFAKTELERLDELERRIERMTRDFAALSSQIESLERHRSSAAELVKKAQQANQAVEAASAGFAIYNDASSRLVELEPQAVLRDALKKDVSEKERERFKIEASIQAQREKLEKLEGDKAELDRLGPFVDAQISLEKRRAELQTLVGELAVLR